MIHNIYTASIKSQPEAPQHIVPFFFFCADIKERQRFISRASSAESSEGTSSLKFRRPADSCDRERHTHII